MSATPPSLPQAIVDRVERLQGATAIAVRDAVYAELAAAGVDMPRLARDARMEIVDDLKARAEEQAQLERALKGRVAAGTLPAAKLATAIDRLRRVALRSKKFREQIRRLEARPEPLPPSAPTRELVRHYGEAPVAREREVDGTPLSAPRYHFEWPIDRLNVPLNAEQYQAAQRLRDAFLRRDSTPKAVDWNGSGRSAPGPRLPISEAQLKAGRDYNAIWHRLPPELRLIVANFLFEQAPRGRDQPLTPLEFGQVYGELKDKAMARGVTIGAIKATCAAIARHFRDYDQWRAEQKRVAAGGGARQLRSGG